MMITMRSMHTMMIQQVRSHAIALWVIIGLLSSGLLWDANWSHADQARYFYDELGRLIGVVDGQNNAAVYTYDEVGNLLKIDRFSTTGGSIGIFLVSPGSAIAKNPDGTSASKPVEIRGFGFTSPASSNTVAFNGVTATVVSATSESIIATVPATATTGPVTVTNNNGTATSPTTFTVLVPPIITGLNPMQIGQGVTTRGHVAGFNLKTASEVQFSQIGLTATILSGASDENLPINLTVGTSVPPGFYTFSVATPSGTTQSGTIKVEVRPGFPSFNVSNLVTVGMPLNTSTPATSQPTGPSSSASSPVTVRMPLDATATATAAPSGPSFEASPVTSVSMP